MTDERFTSSVGDWLKETDMPPRDTRSAVAATVSRARTTSQAGRWWPPLGWNRAGVARWRPALASVVTLVVLAVVGIGVLGSWNATIPPERPSTGAAGSGGDNGLDDYEALFAIDGMTLEVIDGPSFDFGPYDLGIGRDSSGNWSTGANGPTDDPPIELSFDSDGTDWWLDRIRIDERVAGVPLDAREPFNRVPLRDWLYGDVTLELASPPDVPKADRAQALLVLRELRMTMHPDPGYGGYDGDDFAWYMGQLSELARSLAFWDRPPEPQRHAAADEISDQTDGSIGE